MTTHSSNTIQKQIIIAPYSNNKSNRACILIILIAICMMCIPFITVQYNRYTMKYMTLDELSRYDGSDDTKPIYISIRQHIFDVSAAPHYYSKHGH